MPAPRSRQLKTVGSWIKKSAAVANGGPHLPVARVQDKSDWFGEDGIMDVPMWSGGRRLWMCGMEINMGQRKSRCVEVWASRFGRV